MLFAWLCLPSYAQSNPTVAACGLPAQGVITSSVTYTLSADCVQTGQITIANAIPKIQVTINGGGHTITGGAHSLFFGNGELTLNNMTIDGENKSRTYLVGQDIINANNITIIRSRGGPALFANGEADLNNVLFQSNTATSYSLGGNGSALHVGTNAAYTLNNVVLRDNFASGGAANLHPGSTLTTSGCLTLSGNAPYDIYEHGGIWTDNSTGPCSGTIGNGDQAIIPPPELMPCGLPAPGFLDVSATYSLASDCVITSHSTISEHVSIRIEGNGYSIRANPANRTYFLAATASLDLNNVGMSGVRLFNWGAVTGHRISMSDTTLGGIINMGEMRFTNSLFEDATVSSATSRTVLLAWNAYQNGFTRFTDSTFRNNHGGLGVLQNVGATIELIGCIMFENNTPANYVGAVIDNSIDCNSPPVGPFFPAAPVAPIAQVSAPPRFENCDIKLGAIGLICRPDAQPPVAHIWRIRPNPDGQSPTAIGAFLLGVSQIQVEAVAEGLVACSADGRVAVRVGMPGSIAQQIVHSPLYQKLRALDPSARDIVVSKGPAAEGKAHHVVIDHALDGHVLGTVDTYDGLPAPECVEKQPATSGPAPSPARAFAPSVQPQAPQPDGSVLHVVQPGDTLSAIAVAYRVHQLDVIILNQLEAMGRQLYPGQELLIREADS